MVQILKNSYHFFRRVCVFYNRKRLKILIYTNNSFRKEIALTFDDGPHPDYTPQVLALLEKYKIHANFFVSGKAITNQEDLIREMFNSGHVLGNHGYEHLSFNSVSREKMISDLQKTDELLTSITGKKRLLFYRPPYGKATPEYIDWLRFRKKYVVLWSLDSYDYKDFYDVGYASEKLLDKVKNGDILLFHDTRDQAVKILEILIPELIKRHYKFVRLSEKFR